MDVQLNFINKSNDTHNSDIVIFQRNVGTDFDGLAVAWLVIRNCGRDDSHPFTFPTALTVNASDGYGAQTPQLPAQHGQLFAMTAGASGNTLGYDQPATSPSEIQFVSRLQADTFTANVYRNGQLLGTKASIAPQQKAAFVFGPTIWIGVASGVVEGEVMTAAVMADANTELSLLGIASADIVMTGGGPGPYSRPFQFKFSNVVMA